MNRKLNTVPLQAETPHKSRLSPEVHRRLAAFDTHPCRSTPLLEEGFPASIFVEAAAKLLKNLAFNTADESASLPLAKTAHHQTNITVYPPNPNSPPVSEVPSATASEAVVLTVPKLKVRKTLLDVRRLLSNRLGKPLGLNAFCNLLLMLNTLQTFIQAEVEDVIADPQSIELARVENLIRLIKKSIAQVLPGTTAQFMLLLQWLRVQRSAMCRNGESNQQT